MATMRYIDYLPGAASGLHLVSGPIPVAASGEVLIKVSHFGLNRPDIFQRQGHYPPPMGASPILGLELSGEIVAIGDGVIGWQIGDKVCALTNGGGYAEYCAVPSTQCLPIPQGLSMAEAASLPEVMFTVWSNVFLEAGLESTETFLVHAGASGIGSAAIQMASALGSQVIATASSDEKCAFCRDLGAEIAINYHQTDFVDMVNQVTEGRGADVILDIVGGDYVPRNIASAAVDGRIVNIAFLKGAKVNIDMMPVMLKRLSLTGSTLRPRSPAYKALLADQLRESIWPLIEAKRIVPTLALCLPWQRIAEAHDAMENNALLGKAVLEVSP